jgi:hypothetical protein
MGIWSRIVIAVRGPRRQQEGSRRIDSYEDFEAKKELKEEQLSGARFVAETEAPGNHRGPALSDLAGDGGGQMSQVGMPYSGNGELHRGTRNEEADQEAH